MEDAATAEISRSQVWQWVRHGRFTARARARGGRRVREGMEPAAELFERVALDDDFVEFLTLPAAYELLD